MVTTLKPFLLAVVFGLLPMIGLAQTRVILEKDLIEVAKQLSEEQLARLINYAEKLQQEPNFAASKGKREPKSNRPNIFWKLSKYNLEPADKGDVLFLPFKYMNTSKKPYIMTSIKSNCGCVTVELPTEPLLEHESNTIILQVNTEKLDGPSEIIALIYDNSAPRGKSYLKVNVDVRDQASAQH